MINYLDICIHSYSTIETAMKVIGLGGVKIVMVVDNKNRLLGTLNDGDIRRGLLRKKTLNDTIESIYSRNPVIAKKGILKEGLLHLCLTNRIGQVPIIDDDQKIIDIFIMDDQLLKKQHENHVVLMVGGLGMRLRPLTEKTPKSMLNVGDKPILQTIIKGFVDCGFINITMCLGYQSNIIKNYFQDGSAFGANIDYVIEDKRMGTAGALTLLKSKLNKSFFVMNGDLLTNVNFDKMLDFHESNNSKATMCVTEYEIEVPFGVVNLDNEKIISIEEKPTQSFFVNAGMYLLEPECINLIPTNKFYDMPSLFEEMIKNNLKVTSFPLKEYWLDIARVADYEKANREFSSFF
tara:strand:- start:2104 stop:3150 length:1047 start_codon:yes stop_codon:yes gene_type:complete